MEELFNDAKAVPFTHNVIVDEDKMLELIDQMRIAIPEEVKKAQQVVAQRDRVMAQAQEKPTAPCRSHATRQTSSSKGYDRAGSPAPCRPDRQPGTRRGRATCGRDNYAVIDTLMRNYRIRYQS
ncbi:MAG: hypothetical protein IPO22_14550 [Anaerolineales bacterium]|nr:hypothetical protein [Anaerolineales bacterium]